MNEETFTKIVIAIPDRVSKAAIDSFFMEVADLAYELEPDNDEFEVIVYGRSGVKADDL